MTQRDSTQVMQIDSAENEDQTDGKSTSAKADAFQILVGKTLLGPGARWRVTMIVPVDDSEKRGWFFQSNSLPFRRSRLRQRRGPWY